ncbi:MAG: DUF6531 domain-containing protein [Desulfobulbaceae bacterium]|nr:DUF6531 domain-containing protein [Desulfobulbaceae bacterium]
MKKLITIFVAIIFSLGIALPLHAASVNVANGNLYEQVSVSPLGKLPVTISYNSKSERESVVGYGWNANFDIRLLINPDGSGVLIDLDGSEEMFTPNGDGSFTSAADVHDRLEKLGDAFRLHRKSGSSVDFDATGKPLAIMDSNGNATSLVYDNDRLSMLTGPNGEELAFATDSLGRIIAITSSDNKSFAFTYDSNSNLTSITDPAGQTISYGYDDEHNYVSKTNPAGQTNNYHYDDQDRVVSTVNSAGETRTVEYVNDTLTHVIDPAGNATEYTIDQDQKIIHKKDAAGNITANTWDDAGNKTSVADASGTVSMTYDAKGNLLSSTDQLGQTNSYTYNEMSRVTSVTDPQGAVTAFTYDANGNLLTSTDALGNTTTYAYDNKGRLISSTDALGRISTLSYDSQGNAASYTDPLGSVTSMAYDAAGNLTALTDALGNTTVFTYDTLGRMLTRTDPKGQVTSSLYDVLGNRVAVTDANGNITRYEYDHHRQVTRSIDALNQMTVITYLAGSKLPASLSDAKGQTTNFAYDSLGRLIRETDPLGKTVAYQYDARGNVIARIDSAGNTIAYTYDALGRLLAKSFPDGTSASFSYDAKGRLLTAANQHIAYSMTYDTLGRLLSITDANGNTISYEYDKLGNRTRMIMPDGDKVDYRYDEANRIMAIDSFLGAFSLGYNALGRRTELSAPNGVTTEYGYDTAGLLTEIITRRGNRDDLLSSLLYSHDAVGNRLSKSVEERRGYGGGHSHHYMAERFDFTYDAAYQLIDTLAVREGKQWESELRNLSESLSYDPVGNRISGPRWDDIYTHNEANQLLASRKFEFLYDANGNQSAKIETSSDDQDTWTYEYDFENRLVKATSTKEDEIKTVSFKYDPFGRRIEKRVEEIEPGDQASCVKTRTYNYVYDNEDIILEIRSGGDDEDGEDQGHSESGKRHWQKRISKPSINRFVHGPGIDEPLAIEQNGRVYFYHADGLGSIISLTDANGQLVQTYEYDSFGNMRQEGNLVKQSYGFTGREWDGETGLYFYRARYYDPQIGRFISKDPIGFAGGDVVLYGYVNGNPVNNVDPDGLWWRFVGWEDKRVNKEFHGVQWYSGRFLYAKCQNTCTDETMKILVVHERYLPIPTTNVNNVMAPNPLGNSPHPVSSLFDIEKDMRDARKNGCQDNIGNARALGGQHFCNKYNNIEGG